MWPRGAVTKCGRDATACHQFVSNRLLEFWPKRVAISSSRRVCRHDPACFSQRPITVLHEPSRILPLARRPATRCSRYGEGATRGSGHSPWEFSLWLEDSLRAPESSPGGPGHSYLSASIGFNREAFHAG